MADSCEQRAREMLDRMDVPGALDMSAGEVVEVANLINASSLVRELAESTPFDPDSEGDTHCYFCQRNIPLPTIGHSDTCLWLRARKMAGMT